MDGPGENVLWLDDAVISYFFFQEMDQVWRLGPCMIMKDLLIDELQQQAWYASGWFYPEKPVLNFARYMLYPTYCNMQGDKQQVVAASGGLMGYVLLAQDMLGLDSLASVWRNLNSELLCM